MRTLLRQYLLHKRKPHQIISSLKHIGLGVSLVLISSLLLTAIYSYTRGSTQRAYAAAPTTLNFQARLLNGNGSIVADGIYNVEFKLYNASTSSGSSQGSCAGDANCLWTETRLTSDAANLQIQVKSGYLSVHLGDKTALPANIWNQQLYLTMNIGGTSGPTWDGEMTPRIRLDSVPFAYQATNAANLQTVSGANTSTLSINAPTVGNQIFQIADQGAAGTYTVCVTTCGPTGGSGNYIQNTTSLQTAANFNIQAANSGVNGTIGGIIRGAANGQTVDLFQLQATGGGVLAKFNANGDLSIGGTGAANSATALQILNNSGLDVATVDTVDNKLVIRSGSSNSSVGSELLSGNCSGTNWSGTGSGPYAHTAGSAAALTCTITGGVTSGATYQVVFTTTGMGSTDTVTPNIGGGVNGQATTGNVTSMTEVITTTGTSNPTFTLNNASSTGSITSVSFKQITNTKTALQVNNSSNVTTLEVRSSGSASNIFVGINAGQSNVSGSGLTALGTSALQSNTSGTDNTAIGWGTLNFNTTGIQNTALGSNSLRNNTIGGVNTALGYNALNANTSGSSNTAIGGYALQSNTNGTFNTAIGRSALTSNTSGTLNSALGTQALQNNTTGSYNLGLGYAAGYQDSGNNFSTLGTISNSVAIGAYAQVQASNSIVLGSVDTATKVGIGTTIPANTFSVSPLEYQTGTVCSTATAGGGTCSGTSTTFLLGSGTTWTSGMVGDTVIFADGTSRTVTAFTDATHVTLSSAVNMASGTYYRFHKVGLQVTTTARLGLGTASPLVPLHVVNQDVRSRIYLDTYGDSSTLESNITGWRARGTEAAPTATQSSDILMALRGGGYGATTFSNTMATIALQAAENWTDSAQGTQINFQTTPLGSTTTNTVMRLNGSSVQIGSSTTDASAIPLILDSYNNATDPTGTNGGTYYNTSTNTFRCYQNGAWTNCIGSGANPTLQQAYANSTGGTTPEILLDTTRTGLDVQDANTTLGSTANLFTVRGSATATTLGSALFTVLGSSNTGVGVATPKARLEVLDNTVGRFATGYAGGVDLDYGTAYMGLNAVHNRTTNNYEFYADGVHNGGTVLYGEVGDGSLNIAPITSTGNSTQTLTQTQLKAATVLKIADTYTTLATKLGIKTASTPQQTLTLGAANDFAIELAPPTSVSVTATTGGSLVLGQTYYFVVAALNSYGMTVASNEAGPCNTTLTNNRCAVSWTKSVGEGLTYRVYYGTTSGTYNNYFAVGDVNSYNFDTTVGASGGSPQNVTTAYNVRLRSNNTSYLDGALGIGTITPYAKLSVIGTIQSDATSNAAGSYSTFISSNTPGWSQATYSNRELRIQTVNSGGNYNQYLLFDGRISGDLTTPVYNQGDWGRFSGVEFAHAGDINFLVNTGSAGSGSNTTITPTKALTILQSAKVGVGDTNPATNLVVKGTGGGVCIRNTVACPDTTAASLFIENNVRLGVDARTIANNGTGGSNATLTLNPTASFVEIICNDPDGCDITMDEASPVSKGQLIYIVNASSNTVNFADTANVSELNGAYAAGAWDSISIIYSSNRWVELGRSNN